MLTNKLKQDLEHRKQRGLYRKRQVADGHLLNFSSNDYLSLSGHAAVQNGYKIGIERFSAGSGGSMLVSGYHPVHQALECAFAKALNVDACILFSSGYAANLSVMNLLGTMQAHVLLDKAAHASIYDGLKLSEAPFSRYLHNNLDDLALKVQTMPARTVLITESIFSMSGQRSSLAKIAQIANPYGYELLVDEAHAFGIVGREGLGAVIHEGLTQADVPLRMVPFGKAYGAFGAIVAGQGVWIDALLQAARPAIYSTAMSPAYAYGLMQTLDIIRGADLRREKLTLLVSYFRERINQSSLTWGDSVSPIQQLQLGCPHQALSFSMKLKEQGILCMPIRQPTVAKAHTGLRVILNHNHQPEDIDRLFQCLHAL